MPVRSETGRPLYVVGHTPGSFRYSAKPVSRTGHPVLSSKTKLEYQKYSMPKTWNFVMYWNYRIGICYFVNRNATAMQNTFGNGTQNLLRRAFSSRKQKYKGKLLVTQKAAFYSIKVVSISYSGDMFQEIKWMPWSIQ